MTEKEQKDTESDAGWLTTVDTNTIWHNKYKYVYAKGRVWGQSGLWTDRPIANK